MIVDDDVLVRLALADYLRECGYKVLEIETTDNAVLVLRQPEWKIDFILSAVEVAGSMDGFGLARWVRSQMPDIQVMLAGTPAKAADVAGDLCVSGPELSRPYDPRIVAERIRRFRTLDTAAPALAH